MSVTSCPDFKPSLHRNASFKFHSFDHVVEVNSRLLTITNTSQISLGGVCGGGGGGGGWQRAAFSKVDHDWLL